MSKKKKQKQKPSKSSRFALIESKSSRGVCYGYTIKDSPIIMLSSDKNVALDFLFELERTNGKSAHDFINAVDLDVEDEGGQDGI